MVEVAKAMSMLSRVVVAAALVLVVTQCHGGQNATHSLLFVRVGHRGALGSHVGSVDCKRLVGLLALSTVNCVPDPLTTPWWRWSSEGRL